MINAIRYGVLFALVIFLWAVVETLVGLHGRYIRYHEYLSYFFAVPAVYMMYWGIRSGGHAGPMSFRNAFAKGLGITLVAALLCPLVWYAFCVAVNPAFLDAMVRNAVEHEGMAEASALKRFSLVNHLVVSTIAVAVINVVIALVIATIVAQRKK